MLKVTVKNNVKFPEILVSEEDLENMAKDIVIPDIVRGIDTGMAITGGALPHNEPATIKRKGGDRPLIDTGTLRRSFFHRVAGKNKVIVTIEPERKDIGGYLQDGIKTKTGFKQYLFFGISVNAIDGMIKYMKRIIQERIDGRSR